MQRVKENREKGWSLTRNSPLKAPDTYMQVDVQLLTLSSMLFLIKTVKLCFIINVLKKEQAENFTVYYEKNKEFFVCNTFKNFVQYKIGFMDFFFSSQHYGKIGGVKKREHWDLILGPRTELPFVLALGLQRRWFICWL